jgi:hypothetical protein
VIDAIIAYCLANPSQASAPIMLAVASCALIVNARATGQQVHARDVTNLLDIQNRIAEALRRVRDADDTKTGFELIELFNLLEAIT